MTEKQIDLVAALAQSCADLGHPLPPPSPRRTYSPADYEDEDTLRRSFGGLSKHARTVARRPVPLRTDEYGYDRAGRWYADRDGVA